MKTVRLNRNSLDDRFKGAIELRITPARVAYVSEDESDSSIGERGLPEYIFAYRGSLPTPMDEPELHSIPHEMDVKSLDSEVWLKYQKATVILITEEEDTKFRKGNKALIERIETLYVD